MTIAQVKAKRRKFAHDKRYKYGRKDAAVSARRLRQMVADEQARKMRAKAK